MKMVEEALARIKTKTTEVENNEIMGIEDFQSITKY